MLLVTQFVSHRLEDSRKTRLWFTTLSQQPRLFVVSRFIVGGQWQHTRDTSVVRLDGNLDDLPIFCDDSVTLTSVVAQDLCSIEFDIPSSSELAGGVSEESNATGFGLVQALSPRLHAGVRVSKVLCLGIML